MNAYLLLGTLSKLGLLQNKTNCTWPGLFPGSYYLVQPLWKLLSEPAAALLPEVPEGAPSDAGAEVGGAASPQALRVVQYTAQVAETRSRGQSTDVSEQGGRRRRASVGYPPLRVPVIPSRRHQFPRLRRCSSRPGCSDCTSGVCSRCRERH